MKITPLDIRQKRFEAAVRGFSKREVEAFLELLAGEFEELVKENISLKEELKRTQLQFESQVRSVIDAHLQLLETFRAPSFADRDWERVEDNVSFLAQK